MFATAFATAFAVIFQRLSASYILCNVIMNSIRISSEGCMYLYTNATVAQLPFSHLCKVQA